MRCKKAGMLMVAADSDVGMQLMDRLELGLLLSRRM